MSECRCMKLFPKGFEDIFGKVTFKLAILENCVGELDFMEPVFTQKRDYKQALLRENTRCYRARRILCPWHFLPGRGVGCGGGGPCPGAGRVKVRARVTFFWEGGVYPVGVGRAGQGSGGGTLS